MKPVENLTYDDAWTVRCTPEPESHTALIDVTQITRDGTSRVSLCCTTEQLNEIIYLLNGCHAVLSQFGTPEAEEGDSQ